MTSTKLDRVEIENYRAIGRLVIDLDELTTVIGEHDCGKSSLLRAIAAVLDPALGDGMPQFDKADFHRPFEPGSERTSELSITLSVAKDRLRVRAERNGDDKPTTHVDVIDQNGRPIDGADGPALLAELRHRHPAVIVGRSRPALGARASSPKGSAGQRLRTTIQSAARTNKALTWDELVDVREELIAGAGVIADQLAPTPARRRSVREMTDIPRPLTTDLGDALEADAGSQRRVPALWLLMSILNALPESGLADDADPILLFDDIEANLHPTWLAALCSVAINLPFQEVVATHSSEVLTWLPLSSLRRLHRTTDGIEARAVRRERYSNDELRRLTFHLRLNRSSSFFARCWVLVEGETEAWLIPEFARLSGVEFPIEGIRCIEFAQSGISPLLKAADDLGIKWLLLSDGDQAGKNYAKAAREGLGDGDPGRVVVLPAKDIEHYLFKSGYAKVIKKAAGRTDTRSAGKLISTAVQRISKPGLALQILAEADHRGASGVPPVLRRLSESAQELARH